MSSIFQKYCANALAALRAQSATASSIGHGASLGAVREQLIRQLLESHLPELVSMVTGEIFDTLGQRSTQQDAVLVLKSMPRLPFATGIDLIYAEGVVSNIEIKSQLSGPVTKDVGKGIASVRNLTIQTQGSAQLGLNHKWPSGRILSAIVAFTGSNLPTITSVLDTMDECELPDMVLNLEKGLLVRNEGLLLPTHGSSRYIEIEDAAMGFMYFLTFLTEVTGTMSSRIVPWRKYW